MIEEYKYVKVYRGDSTNFNLQNFEFGRELRKNKKDLGSTMSQGPGLYFTTDLEQAKCYGKYITCLKISPEFNFIHSETPKFSREFIKKLVSSFDKETIEIAVSGWRENPKIGMKMLIDNIYGDEYIEPIEQIINIWAEVLYHQDPEQFIKDMVSNGIDGIITDNLYILYNLKYI